MNMRNILAIATAVALCAGTAALGAPLTKDEYKAGRAKIAAEYEAERQKCGVRHGNDADLCIARAHGMRNVAKAELEAAYKPGPRTNYDAAIARAQSTYAIAKEECDDKKKGDARKGCMKDAKSAQERAKAEAAAARKAALAEQAKAGAPR
jgi:hypothetical protein